MANTTITRPVVTMNLANRSITRVGLLANRVMHPLVAARFGREVGMLAQTSDVKIMPSPTGITVQTEAGETSIELPLYAKLLGKAGISEMEIPRGTAIDQIGNVFRDSTTKGKTSLNGSVYDFRFQGRYAEPLTFSDRKTLRMLAKHENPVDSSVDVNSLRTILEKKKGTLKYLYGISPAVVAKALATIGNETIAAIIAEARIARFPYSFESNVYIQEWVVTNADHDGETASWETTDSYLKTIHTHSLGYNLPWFKELKDNLGDDLWKNVFSTSRLQGNALSDVDSLYSDRVSMLQRAHERIEQKPDKVYRL